MSETEKFVGKIQLRPRLENESDKDYFERITGKKWQVYDYEPENIYEAMQDNDITYYEAKRGKKAYCYINKNIYEFLELKKRDIEECYCNIEKINDNTYSFETMFYNGGTDLAEMLQDEFEDMK